MPWWKTIQGPGWSRLHDVTRWGATVGAHNAQILADALSLTAQLQTALSTRPVIDQAIGLIRGRTGRSVEDAFAHLRAMSQTEHRKLADVAQQIVDEAVRRARARHRPTE